MANEKPQVSFHFELRSTVASRLLGGLVETPEHKPNLASESVVGNQARFVVDSGAVIQGGFMLEVLPGGVLTRLVNGRGDLVRLSGTMGANVEFVIFLHTDFSFVFSVLTAQLSIVRCQRADHL